MYEVLVTIIVIQAVLILEGLVIGVLLARTAKVRLRDRVQMVAHVMLFVAFFYLMLCGWLVDRVMSFCKRLWSAK